ncbi:MAG: hypothetical protein IT204_00625 [Fimbriimonadaceae bacterium]|nr:hypothetical protein [Fimbriimonadaceae bacterium]
MPDLPLGKFRRLQALADWDGRLQWLSVDQAPVPLEVVAALSGQASAALLAADAGLPALAATLDRGCALLATASAAADEGLCLLPDEPLARAAQAGAAGVVARFTALADEAAQGRLRAQLERIGEEAAKLQVPLVLAPQWATAPTAAELSAAVAGWQPLDLGADLLLLPAPADSAWAELAAALPLPWLLGLTGDWSDALPTSEAATRGGAAGVACEGLTWRDGGDEPGDWLTTEGLGRWRRLVAAADQAQPWWDHPRWGGHSALRITA